MPMHALRRKPEISLDGTWQFQLRATDTTPEAPDWETAEVPGLWTMTSIEDRPHYTNVPMPFDEVYPAVPDANPLGVYRRTVDLQPAPGHRVVLHVGAAEGQLRVAVNGEAVGTSADSHLAAEFDITDVVTAGANTIELAVAKWSAGSYLEDQDHWWQSGLSRSVFLYTVPEIRLADLSVRADFDPATERGSLRVVVSTEGLRGHAEVRHTVRVQVLGETHELPVAPRLPAPTLPTPLKPPHDRAVRPARRLPDDFMDILSIKAAAAPVPPEYRAIPDIGASFRNPPVPAGTARLDLADLAVPPWSAERPELHDVLVELVDPEGAVVDSTSVRVGFRRVTIDGRDLLVNGRRILVQGVNRHDIDPRTGRVLSRERMLAELSLLKRCNVNAIRTSHYPNDPVLLDLCDELGFYVVAEADIESHAFASTLADDPRYLTEIVERVARMVLRDRNHPSVLIWSLGNESGYGAAHDAAAAWVRRFDPTRPVQYEGAIATDWHGGHAASDLVVPMYPSFAALRAYSADHRADRPLITCEYAYSQGNSTGGFADYWDLFETLPGLQGGFLWEFTDQALDPDGDGRYRYGGDFGDEPHNGPTLLNGVVFADLTPKPALYEVRGVFSPLRVVSDAETLRWGQVRVRNRQSFADLSGYVLEVRVDTRHGPSAVLAVATPDLVAGQEGTLLLPGEIVQAAADPDALGVSLVVRTRSDAQWAPAGTEVAVEQIALPRPLPALPTAGRPVAVDAEGDVSHPLLARAPRLSLWRALTDNDRAFSLDQRFVRSGFFALEPVKTSVTAHDDRTATTTHYRTAFGDEIVHYRELIEAGSDDFVFREDVILPEDTRDGLRVGMVFELAGGFRDATWVGLGPWENYPDRRRHALLGRWTSTIDDLAVPYVRPQEHGTRGGVTELAVTGPAGRVAISTPVPVHVNVGRHTAEQLESADHWWELPESEATVIHVDVAHRGIGTALLGPDTRPVHRLAGTRYSWAWRLHLQRSEQ
ncbi:glycoside hydrolase family 2 TIM barrel-domain containing protein [Amycolatopsis sp. NPDC021455]|uniref:glycoside hydrolase family 2 TIM barrel-domain containing protein n=1 Tax=Amycolatopsis sp. NPDC021455 TaxID=3154901 RepID=UPI0034080863